MTITISNLTVAQNAPAGTIVGTLTASDVGSIIPCNFILSKSSSGYFAISSNNIVTVWSGSVVSGSYPVRVRAVGITTRFSGSATFIVNVIAPSLPTPTGVTFVTKMTSLPDNSPAGTAIATVSVSMSDGSAFAGSLAASPSGAVTISGNKLVLARALTSADNGMRTWSAAATQNGVTVSGSIQVQVNAVPTSVSFTPSAPSLPDNAAAGTVVAAVSVSMSDGSAFTGMLAASPSGTVTISGKNLVLARALASADNGQYQWSAAATQNGVTVSGSIPVQIASPPPPPPPPPLPSGPNAEWTLTQASVSGATVADASGNGNAGTVMNGPLTFGAMGANFNGQQYVDSALTVTSSALTVSVWFNAANLSNANQRLVANSHTDTDAKGFQLMFNGGGGSGFFDIGNGTAEGRASWSKQLVVGTWYHYVGVYDGATVSAYLNGVQVASAAFAGGAIAAGTGPDINIARNPTYAGDYLIGAMSDVRIYQRALSAAEILALYQAVTPPPPGTPTAIKLIQKITTIPDNAPAGTVIATASVTTSDGLQFAGYLTSNNPLFAISGLNIVTAQLTSADDGPQTALVTAYPPQGSQSLSMEFSI